MTPAATPEAPVEALTKTMWDQSYSTLANASWDEAHRIAKAIPDGQAAWNIETVRRKAAEIVNQHIAPVLADLQRVTAERDEYAEAMMQVAEAGGWQASAGLAHEVRSALATATAEAASLRAEVEAVLDEATRMSSILLMAGEMTAQERRTARAVAEGIASKIRTALARAATAREG
ncbi:hypothetical protein ABEV34_28585 [Methylorubrum rhodesianum]|uniref:hypothetical protein n=1 Tax=Methylorubrum rhodesianum TaxID=29427 RepID=UPI0016071D38|nr:hypothetical protein [Methylorubrum rhodesianum]MBB5764638.1 hypothetical protein [Methylorubrum rhodesianum]